MNFIRSLQLYFYASVFGIILGFAVMWLFEKPSIPTVRNRNSTVEYQLRSGSTNEALSNEERSLLDSEVFCFGSDEEANVSTSKPLSKFVDALSQERRHDPWAFALVMKLKGYDFEGALDLVEEITPVAKRADFLLALLEFVRIYDKQSEDSGPNDFKERVRSIASTRLENVYMVARSLPHGASTAKIYLCMAKAYRHPIFHDESKPSRLETKANELEKEASDDFIAEGRKSSSIATWLKTKYWLPLTTGILFLLSTLLYETSMKLSRHYSNKWLLKVLRDEEVQSVLNKK